MRRRRAPVPLRPAGDSEDVMTPLALDQMKLAPSPLVGHSEAVYPKIVCRCFSDWRRLLLQGNLAANLSAGMRRGVNVGVGVACPHLNKQVIEGIDRRIGLRHDIRSREGTGDGDRSAGPIDDRARGEGQYNRPGGSCTPDVNVRGRGVAGET